MFAKELKEESQCAVESKAQLEEIWKNESQALYEPTSVFIRRGESPSWGHYFFYSRRQASGVEGFTAVDFVSMQNLVDKLPRACDKYHDEV